ncbi:hypothetical protein NFI96_025340 [Prochilodus magdalenae]|nr:hypothetical protein NFI96_025340 [Prochilodus magdalenae]
MKEVSGAMNTITGCKNNSGSSVDGGVDKANQFNNFYNRFDCPAPTAPSSDPSAAFTTLLSPPSPSPPPSLSPSPPSPSPPPSQSSPPSSAGGQSNTHGSHCPPAFTADQVRRQLRRLHPRKAAGPDKVCPRMLKVHHAEDPLQFAYREKVGVEDAILYLLHRTHCHLDKGGGAVRVMFFDFSSAFNTIQPLLLRDKLMMMEVDMHLVTWITDYLTGRPQHVRISDCSSDTVISSTGAPQGTVLSPVLFTLYTSDFKYNSELCHMQKFWTVLHQWTQDSAHRTLPTGRCPQDAAHRTLPTGRCPQDAAGCIVLKRLAMWVTTQVYNKLGKMSLPVQMILFVMFFMCIPHGLSWPKFLIHGGRSGLKAKGDHNNLSLNISKTKEMIVDYRKLQRGGHSPLYISGAEVEQVSNVRFLGVHLTEDLTWSLHTNKVVRSARQRLFFLRRLRKFGLPPDILTSFYRCTIESALTTCMTVWYGSCTAYDRKALKRVVRTAESIIGSKLPDLQDIYRSRCLRTSTSPAAGGKSRRSSRITVHLTAIRQELFNAVLQMGRKEHHGAVVYNLIKRQSFLKASENGIQRQLGFQGTSNIDIMLNSKTIISVMEVLFVCRKPQQQLPKKSLTDVTAVPSGRRVLEVKILAMNPTSNSVSKGLTKRGGNCGRSIVLLLMLLQATPVETSISILSDYENDEGGRRS